MTELISVDALIKKAKKADIDLGKGDPYNRLRYYTKLGWLPHMQRKGANAQGHYPLAALERLQTIDKLKKQGTSREEITKILNKKSRVQAILDILKTKEIKTKLAIWTVLSLLILILGAELELIDLRSSKTTTFTQTNTLTPNMVIASGNAFVPKNQRKIFVKTKEILDTHKVYVTFNNNIAPAMRYWVDTISANEGFSIQLDTAVAQDAQFTWWITN